MKIVFIGAGNLATQLAKAIRRDTAYDIIQVYSHTLNHAKELGEKVHASFTNQLENIITDADIYIFALKDSVLKEVIENMPDTEGLWVHTSGSMPMDIFSDRRGEYGVLYPMQTFSKTRDVDFKKIYFYLEGSSREVEEKLERFAGKLSIHTVIMSSEDRRKLHLAAVFACNFSNHMYTLAYDILGNNSSYTAGLIPLIEETAAKIHELTPSEAQTGPAIRYDENVINKHLNMIEDERTKEIYQSISESIHERSNLKKK